MVASGALIYLFRHGEVVLAETRRFIGRLDVPLSPLGERQSAAQAARLASVKLGALFTSDLTRARRTGEIIGGPHGLRPTVVPELREMAMGRWEGLTAAQIQRTEPEKFAEWMSNVGEFPFPTAKASRISRPARGRPSNRSSTPMPGRRSRSSRTGARTAR